MNPSASAGRSTPRPAPCQPASNVLVNPRIRRVGGTSSGRGRVDDGDDEVLLVVRISTSLTSRETPPGRIRWSPHLDEMCWLEMNAVRSGRRSQSGWEMLSYIVSFFFRFFTTGLLLIGSLGLLAGGLLGRSVEVVVGPGQPPAVGHAVHELERALRDSGRTVVERPEARSEEALYFVAGVSGESSVLDELLAEHNLKLSKAPESLLVHRIADTSPSTIVVAGSDTRGLMYALYEVAAQVASADSNADLLSIIQDIEESPFLPTRSLTTQLFNADLEAEWYFDEAYWHQYFSMLARNRYNNYTLTFGHQTNYLTPPYPWMLEVADYPDVRVRGVSDDERRRNLQMFVRIAELAVEHGLDFTFGLWSQQPVQEARLNYGESDLENYPEGARAVDYNAKALTQLLQAAPAVSGVQFRMNRESGIPEEQQEAFYQLQFDAIKNSGRSIRLDLRYKGLQQQTIDQAVNTGLDVTVSSKYWCEHLGLPYHPTIEDDLYRESRYGYGAMLFHNRNYRVTYRLWNLGSSRLLLWGDPEYARRFVRSATLGGGEGFEVFQPLSMKGFGNEPGVWRIFVDKSFEHYRWEYERYWLNYMLFGRMGYNPDASSEIWQREFRQRFGAAGSHLQEALTSASRVLPLLTATKSFSASIWRYWPEMNTGGPLEAYAVIQPSDYGQFYAIKPWEKAEGWLDEDWASGFSGFVEDAIAGKLQAKWTPIQVSRRLNELADRSLASLKKARRWDANRAGAEYRATALDVQVLAALARYHAEKTIAATHLEFFHVTKEPGRISQALEHIRAAAGHWKRLASLTEGVYHDKLVFGRGSWFRKIGHHAGHWKDSLPEVLADVTYLEKLAVEHGAQGQEYRTYPGETPLGNPPVVEHRRLRSAKTGKPLKITVRVAGGEKVRNVLLHHRAMNHHLHWQSIPMEHTSEGEYEALIPAKQVSDRYDLLYYVEVQTEDGGVLWPSWSDEMPYVVVSTSMQ